jgi:hypothetical protein
MDWVITFPNTGNKGKKYPDYSVMLSDLKKGNLEENVCLIDIVENAEFQSKFPHTVGFSKSKICERPGSESRYLEIRLIRSVEDFWKFLNDLDL